jgi:SAM-dependent methyltransferase
MWAVLSFPEKHGNKWNRDEFFATGREEVSAVMCRFEKHGLPKGRDRCLDFGCGPGRLTQAFAQYFARCDGIDVAPSMIDLANRLNTEGDRCTYHVNGRCDLGLFANDTFDLVYTRLVLQHIPPELTRGYISEFIRVIRPGGLAVFQVPSHHVRRATPAPLTAEAYRASLEVLSMPRIVCATDAFSCLVRVRNTGNAVWPISTAPGSYHLANHWLDAYGRMVTFDDQRADLPGDLRPGEEAEVSITVVAPPAYGLLQLEFDLVHEGVCWFAERGSNTVRRRLAIAPAWRRKGPAIVDDLGARPFEMHWLPKDDVLPIIAASGGRLVETQETDDGPFYDVTYAVTKP